MASKNALSGAKIRTNGVSLLVLVSRTFLRLDFALADIVLIPRNTLDATRLYTAKYTMSATIPSNLYKVPVPHFCRIPGGFYLGRSRSSDHSGCGYLERFD